MIQTNSQPLQDILLAFLRQEGLETPLLEFRITQAWPEVMGEMVNRYTKQVFVRDGKLHVQLTSAPLRQNGPASFFDFCSSLEEVWRAS